MTDDQTQPVSADPDLEETYVHFGPGVPMTPPADRATAIWRGQEEPGPGASGATTVRTARPRGQRWIAPITVLILVIAIVAYFLWGKAPSSMTVTGVSVRTSSATVACSGQETLTGVIATDGGAGVLTFQWVRSDGTKSAVLDQTVNAGEKLTDVTLLWTFDGTGSLHATAVLNVLGPGAPHSASVSFIYSCAG